MEQIIPMSTSKAYDASHLTFLSQVFDHFRIALDISPSTLEAHHSQGSALLSHPHSVLT